MTDPAVLKIERWTIATFVRRLPQVHLGVGVLGNALFVVGAVLYLTDNQNLGTYFFLAGSIGMLLGSLGEILRAKGRETLERHDIDPEYPRYPWSEQHSSPSALE